MFVTMSERIPISRVALELIAALNIDFGFGVHGR